MGVEGKVEIVALRVKAVADGPPSGQQIVSVYLVIVLHDVSLSSHQKQVGEVGSQRMVSQCSWGRRLRFILKQAPSGRLVVEAASVKILEDSSFCAEAAVQVDASRLDARREVGPGREIVAKLELHPTSIDFFAGISKGSGRGELQGF